MHIGLNLKPSKWIEATSNKSFVSKKLWLMTMAALEDSCTGQWNYAGNLKKYFIGNISNPYKIWVLKQMLLNAHVFNTIGC